MALSRRAADHVPHPDISYEVLNDHGITEWAGLEGISCGPTPAAASRGFSSCIAAALSGWEQQWQPAEASCLLVLAGITLPRACEKSATLAASPHDLAELYLKPQMRPEGSILHPG